MVALPVANPALAALLGVAVGDALGLAVEFLDRAALRYDPVLDMRGHGTHNQLPGTWSDDSSLTFCTAESLCRGLDASDMAIRFIRWRNEGYWSARGAVFDIGMTTSHSIDRLQALLEEDLSLSLDRLQTTDDRTNGNGSLMRILPLLFAIHELPLAEQFKRTWLVSALTHGHLRSAMACFIYLRMASRLLEGLPIPVAYAATQNEVTDFFREAQMPESEVRLFDRVLVGDIDKLPDSDIQSGGYVIHTLEAALWCLLRHDDFAPTVLAAVNLGHDTDTTAAVAGGLAGLAYGADSIPTEWLSTLARLDDIFALADRVAVSVR